MDGWIMKRNSFCGRKLSLILIWTSLLCGQVYIQGIQEIHKNVFLCSGELLRLFWQNLDSGWLMILCKPLLEVKISSSLYLIEEMQTTSKLY